jgi:hypothetical protein
MPISKTLVSACAAAALASGAFAQTAFTVTVTADNQYGLYTGTETSADLYVGGAFNTSAAGIFQPETYNLTLPDSGYIYITAWSDLSVYQGLMARFDSSAGTFYAGQSGWEVTATGIFRANGAAPVTLPDLSTEIINANNGTNPAGGWVTPTLGDLNNNGSLWGATVGGGMGPDANWTWYDSGDDSNPNAPFVGFNHDEYLIFRLPVNIPAPGAAAVLGVALLGAARRRR